MVAIPVWLIGQHITTLNIIPQAVAADGTLSDGATSSLVGCIDEISPSLDVEEEEISPMTATTGNMVTTLNMPRLILVEVLRKNGVNILAAAAAGSDYFKIVFVRGSQTWTGYFKRGAYQEGIRRGKSSGTLNLQPCGINVGYA